MAKVAKSKATNRITDVLPSTNGNGHAKQPEQSITIAPPDMRRVQFRIKGVDPYMQLRFSMKAQKIMLDKHKEGGAARSKRTRAAKDVDADYEGAMYRLPDGGYGIPAAAFRQACISACRTVGFKMTVAKLSLFIIQDGLDSFDRTPLVRLTGKPEMSIMPVRNATGVADMRVRAMFPEWSATVTVEYDAGQMTLVDLSNLMARAGLQVGVGEGRPDSKNSAGIGMGRFKVVMG